jgi:hypothetical protein
MEKDSELFDGSDTAENPYTGTPDDVAEYQVHLMTRQRVSVSPDDPSVANLRE